MDLISLIRACAHCGYWFSSNDFLCENCWLGLFQSYEFKRAPEYTVDNRYLFRWDTEKDLIGTLVHGLKGGFLSSPIMRVCEYMVGESWLEGSEDAVVIPSPAIDPYQRDHAYVLAESFCSLYGGYLLSPLLHDTLGKQKGLKRKGRQNRRFVVDPNEPIPKELKSRRIIFIDDVITTGSTALAAYEALDRPRNFSVIAMAYRPLLAVS